MEGLVDSFGFDVRGPRDRDPVAYTNSSTPKVTVQVNFPTCANHLVSVPIPAVVQPVCT